MFWVFAIYAFIMACACLGMVLTLMRRYDDRKYVPKYPKPIKITIGVLSSGSIGAVAQDPNGLLEDEVEVVQLSEEQWRRIERARGHSSYRTTTKTVYVGFWQVFLELEGKSKPTKSDVLMSYKRLAMDYHPDKPTGSHQLMQLLNRAKDEALKSI